MTKEKRFTIALKSEYQKKLDDICKLLHVKQYSKAIKFLIDTYLYIKEDKVS